MAARKNTTPAKTIDHPRFPALLEEFADDVGHEPLKPEPE